MSYSGALNIIQQWRVGPQTSLVRGKLTVSRWACGHHRRCTDRLVIAIADNNVLILTVQGFTYCRHRDHLTVLLTLRTVSEYLHHTSQQVKLVHGSNLAVWKIIHYCKG